MSDADAGGRQGRSCSLAFASSEPSSAPTGAGRPGQPAPLRLEPAGPSSAGDLSQVGLYRLLTNAQLDRELQHTYRVTIRCTDTGEPPLSTTLEFQLIVLVRVLLLEGLRVCIRTIIMYNTIISVSMKDLHTLQIVLLFC